MKVNMLVATVVVKFALAACMAQAAQAQQPDTHIGWRIFQADADSGKRLALGECQKITKTQARDAAAKRNVRTDLHIYGYEKCTPR